MIVSERATDRHPAPIEVHPLTLERFGDLDEVFRSGDPRTCWCMFFRVRARDSSGWDSAANRQALEKVTRLSEAGTGPVPGLVGYVDGRPVGWVSLGPREDYERLAFSKVLHPIDDRPVWSIVCFVVQRAHRGKGLAAALLQAAIDFARHSGATTLEAYPIHESRGKLAAATVYPGTQAMFERAGFRVVDLRQFNASTPLRPIVRLELNS